MKKQPEVTDRTRAALITAFCELYQQRPIEKISVQEITRKVGFNRSTFYQYFCDIYALRAHVEDDLIAAFMSKRQEHLDAGEPKEALIWRIFELSEEKSMQMCALLGEHGSMRFLERMKTEMTPELVCREEWISSDSLFPYLQEMQLSAVLSLLRLWLKNGRDVPVEQLVALCANLSVVC